FQIQGNFEHAYQLLTSYFAEVRLIDPDLVFDIQTASCKDKIFIRCFWCFGAPIKTYKLLRPVVVIDKTFLIGRYRGILTAIAIDLSNHIFSLVFSITESETIESWMYLLEMFGSNFHNFNTRFVVISDRNPRVINVVPKVFLFAAYTFCAFDISNNIKTTFKSVRITFRMAAKALINIDFDKYINSIQNMDLVGPQYILGTFSWKPGLIYTFQCVGMLLFFIDNLGINYDKTSYYYSFVVVPFQFVIISFSFVICLSLFVIRSDRE
ncbi:hypothetical protein GIB67_003779, partial [Kingdonia uniflora]